MNEVRIGVLGCGTVGAALVGLVAEQAEAVAARTGLALRVTRVAVRDPARPRPVALADGALTTDPAAVVADPQVDVVVEVMGGTEPARSLIGAALRAGKPVVTANKQLLAEAGAELFALADQAGVDLLFEAAVAGGIPLIRPLRESLAGDRITRVMGIVNGTTNFVLGRMADDGMPYGAALAEATRLGYAEADPTADVDGHDAAAKAAIITSIAFGARVVAADVYREGIAAVTTVDIAFAARLGYVVKLLAVCEGGDGWVSARVHPAMVPATHPLAAVRGSFNAVFIEAAAAGELMLYGRGAGGRPTAAAVLGDLVDAASNLRRGSHAAIGALAPVAVRPVDELEGEYYLNLEVLDRPGVLRKVAEVFERHRVSIRSMEQEGLGDEARLILITHTAVERDVQAVLAGLRQLDVVDRVGTMLRVVGS